LSAKNDELAELNQSLSRQAESLQDALSRRNPLFSSSKRQHPSTSPSISSLATSATLHEVPEETARVVKVTRPEPQPIEAAPARRFKWYGYKSSKGPSAVTDAASAPSNGSNYGAGGGNTSNTGHSGISRPLAVITNGVSAVGTAAGLAVATAANAASGVVGSSPGSGPNGHVHGGLHPPGAPGQGMNQRPSTEMGLREHAFQQHSTMRLTRCELCGEKMWGLQEVKCACKC
jgi:hypothetical protein